MILSVKFFEFADKKTVDGQTIIGYQFTCWLPKISSNPLQKKGCVFGKKEIFINNFFLVNVNLVHLKNSMFLFK
jgi:hypothetical protein